MVPASALPARLLAESATTHAYNPYWFGIGVLAVFVLLLIVTYSLRRDR